jgi:hypothetical protein
MPRQRGICAKRGNSETPPLDRRSVDDRADLLVIELAVDHQLIGDQLDRPPFVLDHQSRERQDRVDFEAWRDSDTGERFARDAEVLGRTGLLLRGDAGQPLLGDDLADDLARSRRS